MCRISIRQCSICRIQLVELKVVEFNNLHQKRHILERRVNSKTQTFFYRNGRKDKGQHILSNLTVEYAIFNIKKLFIYK